MAKRRRDDARRKFMVVLLMVRVFDCSLLSCEQLMCSLLFFGERGSLARLKTSLLFWRYVHSTIVIGQNNLVTYCTGKPNSVDSSLFLLALSPVGRLPVNKEGCVEEKKDEFPARCSSEEHVAYRCRR